MPLTDAGWAAATIDIIDRFKAGTISKAQAETELAAATNDWPTRTLSSADLGSRILALLAVAADVKGPETNTADHVPQWDGANSKLLKNGRPIGAGSAESLLDRAAGDGRYRQQSTALTISDTTGLQGALDAKAPLANPVFTGNIRLSGTGDRFVDAIDLSSSNRRGLNFTDNATVTMSIYAGGNTTLGANTEAANRMFFRTSGGGGIEKWIFHSAGVGDLLEIAAGSVTNGYVRAFGRLQVDGNAGFNNTNPETKVDILGPSGDQIRLRTAGSEHYRIGRNSGNGLLEFYGSQSGFTGYVFGGVDGTRVTIGSSGHIVPGADNTQNFGSGSLRWATIYAGSGTINTSDERYKVIRAGGDLAEAEYLAWSNVRAIVYRDADSVAVKGDAARLHIGYSWQAIDAAFTAQGLNAREYGLWCEDPVLAPVEKTRTATREAKDADGVPLTTVEPVLDENGEPVFETVQATEEVEQPFEEVRLIDGAPVLVKGTRTVQQPVFDSVQVKDEAGQLLFVTVQATDPETGEPLFEADSETDEPIPVMVAAPRMAPVPRMVSQAKTQTVPVMEEYEETYTEMEPTGETRGALRYQECAVLEAAWLRRELERVAARVAILEGG